MSDLLLFPFADYWWFYAGFVVFVLLVLALDLGVFHRQAHEVSAREAATWSVVWVVLALVFNYLFYRYMLWHFPQVPALAGLDHAKLATDSALEFLAGYVVEKALAVDNVFVFVAVFSYFAVPPKYQHRVLFYGILGALVFRALFISLGSVLMQYHWIVVLFGAFLLLTGIKILFLPEKPIDPERNPVIKLVKRFVPVWPKIEGDSFWVRREGVLYATPLFVALVFIEFSDIIFAIDSVPAIFALTNEPLIVFTSNIFAILGLRAMYFLLASAVRYFSYLKYGLGVILVFVGLKMVWLNAGVRRQVPDHLVAGDHRFDSCAVDAGVGGRAQAGAALRPLSARCSRRESQVDHLDVGRRERLAQENGPDAREAFGAVGGEQRHRARAFGAQQSALGEHASESVRGRRRGIDDGDAVAENLAQRRRQHREMRAAEHERVGMRVVCASHEHVVEVTVNHPLDDGPIGPAFLGQRDEQRTGARRDDCARQLPGDRQLVGPAPHRTLGGKHSDATCARRATSSSGAGFEYAEHRHWRKLMRERIECDGRRGVAGDHEALHVALAQQSRRLQRILANRTCALGAVRQPRGVAEVDETFERQALAQRTQHGEAAYARIENADRCRAGRGSDAVHFAAHECLIFRRLAAYLTPRRT